MILRKILLGLALVLASGAGVASDEPSARAGVEESTAENGASGAEDATQEPREADPAGAKEQPAAEAKPEVVCRMEAEIGSHVKKKVCRLRSDVESESQETHQALQHAKALGSRTMKSE